MHDKQGQQLPDTMGPTSN